MNNTLNSALTEQASNNNSQKLAKAKEIFLGIDAHLKSNQVARKIDNSAIGPVQNLSFEELLLFAHKQLRIAEKVYAVYEAGPLGYVLYRQLKGLGIEANLSAPECLEQGRRKFNKSDARKLCSRLYSYVQGDRQMLCVVRVPSKQEEQLRARSRQYDQLVDQRRAISAQGRSLTLSQGFSSMSHGWWREKPYQQWSRVLPYWLKSQLEVLRPSLALLDQQIRECKKELMQSNDQVLPKGFGAQTTVQLDREIGDWNRFSNRRKVAAFSVLCLESIPLEAPNGWVRSPRLVQAACVPKALNWFGGWFVFNPTTDPFYSGVRAFAAPTKCSRKRPQWQWLAEWSSTSGACAPAVKALKSSYFPCRS